MLKYMVNVGLVLLGFIIGFTIPPSHAQEPEGQKGSQIIIEQTHAHQLTVRELLEVMADFDIRHEDQRVYSGKPAYGVTVFDVSPPTIYIFNSQTHYSKMSTLIHEMVHIRCARIAVECDDNYAWAEENREYQELFGIQGVQ